MPKKSKSLKERLEGLIDKRPPDKLPDGCWIFTGSIDRGGYGRIKDQAPARRNLKAHRAAYQEFKGPIPEGAHLDHTCKNRACVNPKHLDPVTPLENWKRGDSPTRVNALKTHCSEGHPLSGDNLETPSKGRKRRRCRICLKTKQARRRLAGAA